MLSNELLELIKGLNKGHKLELLQELLHDPDLREYAFDPLGIRTNHEAARTMQEMLAEEKSESQQETQ